MADRIRCSAELVVARPADAAMALFTAEGERSWAPGWEPRYPAGKAVDAGSVWTTDAGGEDVYWVVLEQQPEAVRYARVAPAWSAGTVAVTVVAISAGSTRVRVDYDLTALDDAARVRLDEFAADYDTMIAEWGRLIAATAPPTLEA